jgi:hypothetical protein
VGTILAKYKLHPVALQEVKGMLVVVVVMIMVVSQYKIIQQRMRVYIKLVMIMGLKW